MTWPATWRPLAHARCAWWRQRQKDQRSELSVLYLFCGNTLERLQRRVARIVLKTFSSDVALESLKWGNLYNRRNEHILKLVNKCLKGCTPQHFKQYFTYNRDIMTRTTRQSNLLHLPRVRLETTKKSFFYNRCICF